MLADRSREGTWLFALLASLGLLLGGQGASLAQSDGARLSLHLRRLHDATDVPASKCAKLDPVPRKLARVSYYVDTANSIVDAEKLKKSEYLQRPVRSTWQALRDDADRYLRAKPDVSASLVKCLVGYLRMLANADALNGADDAGSTGLAMLYAVQPAFTYALIKHEPSIEASDRELIEAWLRRFGSNLKMWLVRFPRRNNIAFWAGAGFASLAVALDEPQYLDDAEKIATLAASATTIDGLLSSELERGVRALEYSLYATQALAILVYICEVNGRHVLLLGDGALQRVLKNMAKSVVDPASFVNLTGNSSAIQGNRIYSQNLGWLAIYRYLLVDASIDDLLCKSRPHRHHNSGIDWLAALLPQDLCLIRP